MVSASNILITLLIYFYLFRDGKKEDKRRFFGKYLITLLIYFYLTNLLLFILETEEDKRLPFGNSVSISKFHQSIYSITLLIYFYFYF